MRKWIVSVGLNGSPQAGDRLIRAAKKTFCETQYHQPSIDPRIARTETEGLLDVRWRGYSFEPASAARGDQRLSAACRGLYGENHRELKNCAQTPSFSGIAQYNASGRDGNWPLFNAATREES